MTPQELDKLIAEHPVLYHLTWRGAWPSIMEHGLLSTNALLDRGDKSLDKEDGTGYHRRSECVSVESKKSGSVPLKATIRDQKTVDDTRLSNYLEPTGMSMEDWYRRQNARVFFFMTKESPKGGKERGLVALAQKYERNDMMQDMIVVCTKSLINAHYHKIDLSHYNSGYNLNDQRFPENATRGRRHDFLFLRIENYPYRRKDNKDKVHYHKVKELTVVGGVPDIRDHVIKIVEMNDGKEGKVVYPSGSRRSFY